MAQRKSTAGEGFLTSLRNSPETKRLTEEARHLAQAGSGRLTSKLGDGVTGVANKLTDIGDTGSLSLGSGAKRMMSGDGPVKSALGAAATSGITDKAKGLLGKGGKGGGKSKATNIEESIDIGVPVSVAYDQWTQFQDFSRFMKGVESVEQTDDTEATWRAKVFKSQRTFKAKIQEQIPDRRIVWTSEDGKGSTKGVVTFHPLADDLTRVLVALEYYPSGVVEKTGNLWRAAGRRARLDLKNFRRFVMMENEATGSWRGEIREGDVVKGPDEADEDDSERAEQQDERPSRRKPAAAKAEPQKRSRRSRKSKRTTDSGDTPRKEATKRAPAKKQTSNRSSAKESSSSSRSPRKQATKRAPAKKQTSKRAPAKKQTSKRSPATKQTTKRAPAKKSTTKRAPARKSGSSSRSTRQQASKRSPARKRSS